MNPTMTADTYKRLSVSSERTFPAAPFPRKYVHSVFDDLQDAMQAVQALRAAGYAARDIHLMASWDYREAVERRQAPMGFLSSIDEDFVDACPSHEICRYLDVCQSPPLKPDRSISSMKFSYADWR